MALLLRSATADLQLTGPATRTAHAPWSAIFVLTALFYWPMIVVVAPSGLATDYEFHIALAERMAQSGKLETPHFLYQLLVIAVQKAIPTLRFVDAGRLVAFASCLAINLLIYWTLRSASQRRNSWNHETDELVGPFSDRLVWMAMAIGVAGPISIFTGRNFYLGYISATPHHSPTFLLLKPLSLLAFLAFVFVRTSSGPASRIALRCLGIGAIVAVSSLVKPNFAMILMPAALFAGAIDWLAGKGRRTLWIAAAVSAPALATLCWQYVFEFAKHGSSAPRAGIEFAPFAIFCLHTKWHLVLPKFLLSIAFPLALAWTRPAILRQSFELRLAWMIFAVGCVFAYGFAETGPRHFHGNFLWCAHIGLFVLLVASARALVVDPYRGRTWHDRLPWTMLKAQAFCGFVYLIGFATGYAPGHFN